MLSVAEIFKKSGRWGEKQTSTDGPAKIQHAVVIARRPPDKHVLQHLLSDSGRPAIADKVGSEFPAAGFAEGHIVPENLDLSSIFDNACQSVVSRRRLYRIAQLNIRKLLAPDDPLLLFCWKSV